MVSDQEYGVGIVGFGFMGKTHTYGYRTIPFFYTEPPLRYTLKGVCVRRKESIEEAMRIGGFEFATLDYAELLAREDIHIIHVCTPNALHRDQVIQAIRAGKHVYCDKPLGASYEDCRAMLNALETYGEGGLVTQVALQNRFYPCTMRAKQLVEEGFLGRVLSFRACYLHASSINPNKPMGWKLDKSQCGGGVLYDLGAHVLDLVDWLIGPFAEVAAATLIAFPERPDPRTGEMVPVNVDDHVVMCLRTQEGALGTVEATKLATGANDEIRVEIHGEKGAIRFNLMDPNWLEVYDTRDPGEPMGGMRGFKKIETVSRYPDPGGKFNPPALNVGWLRAHVACLHNFLAAIAGKAQATPTIPEAAEIQRVMDIAYRSAERKCWEKV